jgi:hypothetical protein
VAKLREMPRNTVRGILDKLVIGGILVSNTLVRCALLWSGAELRQSILLSSNVFNLTPEIQVYDNKVNIISWGDKLGIIIESEELLNALKAILDLSYRPDAIRNTADTTRAVAGFNRAIPVVS